MDLWMHWFSTGFVKKRTPIIHDAPQCAQTWNISHIGLTAQIPLIQLLGSNKLWFRNGGFGAVKGFWFYPGSKLVECVVLKSLIFETCTWDGFRGVQMNLSQPVKSIKCQPQLQFWQVAKQWLNLFKCKLPPEIASFKYRTKEIYQSIKLASRNDSHAIILQAYISKCSLYKI